MDDLINWLKANKIDYKLIDHEVVEVVGFGLLYVMDVEQVNSVFRKNGSGEIEFNLMENKEILLGEGIHYVAFEFGNNWYYLDIREKIEFKILKYIGQKASGKRTEEFVNLGIHTPFELLNGSGSIADWVTKAKFLGHTAIGICDKNTMAATLMLQKECAKAGINHIFGYSFNLEIEDELVGMKIYAQSQKGLQNLLRIQKEIMVDNPMQTLSLEGLLSRAEGNVLVLETLSSFWMERNGFLLEEFGHRFERVFYQVDISEFKADRIDVQYLHALRHYFHHYYLPMLSGTTFLIDPILICDNYYLDNDDYRNKLLLNKIESGAAHNQSDDQYYKDVDELFEAFSSLFEPQKWDIESLFQFMCQNTVDVAKNAKASYELGRMFMPQYIMREEERKRYGKRHAMFLALIEDGLRRKIPLSKRPLYRERLNEEIYIIESTNNVDYFLIQWDMIREAKKRGIATGVGRGSAGGSLVSYLLDIISIDPIEYSLLFSRFLVPERCGLQWEEDTTKLNGKLTINKGDGYCWIDLEGKILLCDIDAKLRIRRGGEYRTVYAEDIEPGDHIIFDNRDIVWTLSKENE